MPDISLPEVRLREKLPEGLRDMSMDDIQKALPEVRMPNLDLGREARQAGKAAERAARQAAKAAEKAAARAAKEADKVGREAQKAASRQASRASKAAGDAIPRRGPNLVPIAILAMIGGAVVGWILASNPTTGPRISAWLDDMRMRFDAWRARSSELDEEWETSEPRAFTEAGRAPVSSERYTSNLPRAETGIGTPTQLPEGMGTTDPSATDRPH